MYCIFVYCTICVCDLLECFQDASIHLRYLFIYDIYHIYISVHQSTYDINLSTYLSIYNINLPNIHIYVCSHLSLMLIYLQYLSLHQFMCAIYPIADSYPTLFSCACSLVSELEQLTLLFQSLSVQWPLLIVHFCQLLSSLKSANLSPAVMMSNDVTTTTANQELVAGLIDLIRLNHIVSYQIT